MTRVYRGSFPLLNVPRVAYFIRRDKNRFNYDFDDIDCLIDLGHFPFAIVVEGTFARGYSL